MADGPESMSGRSAHATKTTSSVTSIGALSPWPMAWAAMGGGVAARLAVDAWVERIAACGDEPVVERDLLVAVADANRAVFSAASVIRPSAEWAADPRCRVLPSRRDAGRPGKCGRFPALHRLRGDVLTCPTRDHSVLREQWEAGMIESSQAPRSA